MTKLRVIQPGETYDDPHAELIERTQHLRRLLSDLRSCNHVSHNVPGCRGCIAWVEAEKMVGFR